MTDPKKYQNGSEHRVVDKATGEAVPANSGGTFENHADGSQTRVSAPTNDPPCDCDESPDAPLKIYTSLEAKLAARDAARAAAAAKPKAAPSVATTKTPSVPLPSSGPVIPGKAGE